MFLLQRPFPSDCISYVNPGEVCEARVICVDGLRPMVDALGPHGECVHMGCETLLICSYSITNIAGRAG